VSPPLPVSEEMAFRTARRDVRPPEVRSHKAGSVLLVPVELIARYRVDRGEDLPGPPQFRTCGIPASGSSNHGFAACQSTPPAAERIPSVRFARAAIHSSFVQTISEPNVSIVVPFNGSMTRCSLPSAGSLGTVPPLPRYNEAL
jgi:hypothetical protein